MEEEDGAADGRRRAPTARGPRHRRRYKSDTFGFRSKVLQRLRLARSGRTRANTPLPDFPSACL